MRSSDPQASETLLVVSRAMQELVEGLRPVLDCDLPIVLVGATGTGKSLLGRWIHEHSGRRGAFVDCSCAALDPNLARSDLFGHVKGGFTSAVANRMGFFALADGGTLLLDEFHLVEQALQHQLLEVMGARQYKVVGGSRPVDTDCRLVFGMAEDPGVMIEAGRMLPDLRYRMGPIVVQVPRLSERREEIEPLARAFLERYAERRANGGPRRFSRSALRLLEAVEWRGNVRELEFAVQAAYEVARYARVDTVNGEHFCGIVGTGPLFDPRASAEEKEEAVSLALKRVGDRVGEAAKLLGVDRNTVRKWRPGCWRRAHRQEL